MKRSFLNFLSSEDGAVTVDWVVLTAAIVGLGIIVIVNIGGGTSSMAVKVSSGIGSIKVGYGSSLN